MSQRVWTCPCGWRTTAENAAVGVRGDAPARCRRCGGTRFQVTRAGNHPRVTQVCKNPSCRQDFIGLNGSKYCPSCRGLWRCQQAWQGRRKHVWTPERDQLLRDHYRNNPTAIAARFFPGWPKWVVSRRACALGLARVKEKPWTAAEDALVREWAGRHTVIWMARQLRSRTPTAIAVRLKRLHISRRIQADGLTMCQLEQALGVDHRQIKAWWRSGRLKGVYHEQRHASERYEFQEDDVVEFLLTHPFVFRLDRVDQAWFMGLMRDAVQAAREQQPTGAARKTGTREKALPPVRWIGVTGHPCASEKAVVPRRNIPARCPDCTLEFRRRLHRDEAERLRRIRATTAPVPHEAMA